MLTVGIAALAVIAAAGGDGASWEMARWTPAQMPGSASVSFEASEKPADRAGRQTRLEDEHLYDMRRPGWAPVSLALAGDTPWPSVHLPAVPGRMEGYDVAVLSHLDARDHPGTSESIVAAAATWRVRALGGSLTEAEVRAVLTVAGFEGVLFDEALRVSFGESVGWQPRIMGDGGRAYGLFQLHADPWAGWCGVTPEELLEPVVNATCARRIVTEYEEPRGYPRWSNWTVKP